MQPVHIPSFPVRDRAAFEAYLAKTPRVAVHFHGLSCPFARKFRPHFEARADESPVPLAVRELDLDEDREWDDHAIEVTPTIVLYEHGTEKARLEATRGVGLTPEALDSWLARLA